MKRIGSEIIILWIQREKRYEFWRASIEAIRAGLRTLSDVDYVNTLYVRTPTTHYAATTAPDGVRGKRARKQQQRGE